MKFLRTLATIVATLCLSIPLTVAAEEVTISFEGVVDWNITNPDVSECLGLEHGANTTVTGLFIYSTLDEDGNDVPDMDDDPGEFDTIFTDPPNSLIVEVGEFWFKNDPDDTKISLSYYDGLEGVDDDTYLILSYRNVTNSECGSYYFRLKIVDFDGNAIDLDWPVEIPTNAPDLDVWSGSRDFAIETDWGGVNGQVTSIERVYLVDDIVGALETVFDHNPLVPEQETGLLQKVANAMIKFDQDKVDQGCQQLSAFICQLEALLPMFEGTNDYDLASAILDTAYDIFGDQCSDPHLHVMECPMGD